MTARSQAWHSGSGCVAALLMLASIACQRRETPETSKPESGAPPAVQLPVAREVVRVGREFHVLDAMMREHRRLIAEPQTEDAHKKSALLLNQIGHLAGILESAQQSQMNAEERQILATAREKTPRATPRHTPENE